MTIGRCFSGTMDPGFRRDSVEEQALNDDIPFWDGAPRQGRVSAHPDSPIGCQGFGQFSSAPSWASTFSRSQIDQDSTIEKPAD
jgi:hypothetical protein